MENWQNKMQVTRQDTTQALYVRAVICRTVLTK